MTIVLTGGGTGGHITPILAVAHELKLQRPESRIVYIGERRGKFAHLTADSPDIDEVYSIFAGKFRRYNGESFLTRLFAVKDHLLNVRDIFYVIIGILQSLWLLGKIQPAVLFQKGGFVGMPVGLAASIRHIPFVTHDSDILPGLANRVVARWARFNATGMPAANYRYPKAKVRYTGVLLTDGYGPVSAQRQAAFKEEIDIPAGNQLLFVTGGSLGSGVLNDAMAKIVPTLFELMPKLSIVHQVGKGNLAVYGEYKHPNLVLTEFVSGMYRYSGAADLVLTRGGATTIVEFGSQGRACISVPNPLLTGGHQLKNVKYLLQQDAITAIDEADLRRDPSVLEKMIIELLADDKRRQELGANLQRLTPADATEKITKLLLEAAGD